MCRLMSFWLWRQSGARSAGRAKCMVKNYAWIGCGSLFLDHLWSCCGGLQEPFWRVNGHDTPLYVNVRHHLLVERYEEAPAKKPISCRSGV